MKPVMFAAVLTYYDRSGVVGMWGPYESEEAAQAAIDVFEAWPFQYGGQWTIEKLFSFPSTSA
jgi:hypothetical protein